MSRIAKFQLVFLLLLTFVVLAGLSVRRPAAMKQKAQNPAAQSQTRDADVQRVTSPPKLEAAGDLNHSQIEASYESLPLSFEPNRGQMDSRVKFSSRGRQSTLWLTNDEAVLAIGRPKGVGRGGAKQEVAGKQDDSAPAVLRLKFVGANSSPTIEGEARQPGTINYFVGKPDECRTKIPTFARVRYRSLYPGIDLVFYGNNRELEYDLVVAPGADPRQIKLAVTGADEIRIDAEGNLVLKTSQGEVMQQKPKIYQRKGTALTTVAGDYVVTGKDEVGFRLGSYDRRAAVVIDPVLRYSTLLGGSAFDQGRAITVDSSNRAVVAGITTSPDFPRTTGNITSVPQAFVTKFDFTGSRLIYSSVIVGHIDDLGGVALDSAGNAYITGVTESHAFPTTPGAFQTELGGDFDAFVTKLNANGTALVYSTFLGGSSRDAGHGIAVDSSGNAYVTGDTTSTDFPTTPGAFQRNCKLVGVFCEAAFVTKLNPDGSRLLYSTFLGGSATSFQPGNGIAVDRAGDAFITGGTNSSDFPTTAGSAQPVFGGGGEDAFVVKLSPSGSHLIYSTFLGGRGLDRGQAIALDAMGNAFVTGSTSSTNFPVRNAFQPGCAGQPCGNAFVTKLNPSGLLVYSTYLGGRLSNATDIAVTPFGQAYVSGTTLSPSFPTTQTAFQRVSIGPTAGYLTKFDPVGRLVYSSYLGATDGPTAVALDRDTNAYVTGTAAPGFPVTPGAFQQALGGGGAAFVAKVVALCALSTVNRTVTICSPGNGSTVKSPVNIVAGTTDVTPVKLTQVYLDGKKIYETPLSAINVNLTIAGGTHRLTVQGLDTAGVFFKKPISVTVSPH